MCMLVEIYIYVNNKINNCDKYRLLGIKNNKRERERKKKHYFNVCYATPSILVQLPHFASGLKGS